MITVNHLTKRYGSHLAVDDISFTVQDGEIVGFLGPNGAGKHEGGCALQKDEGNWRAFCGGNR